jgi:hypothetical protein
MRPQTDLRFSRDFGQGKFMHFGLVAVRYYSSSIATGACHLGFDLITSCSTLITLSSHIERSQVFYPYILILLSRVEIACFSTSHF